MKRIKKNEYQIKPASDIQKLILRLEEASRKSDQTTLKANAVPESLEECLISSKTKKHKSLGVLSVVFLQLFIARKQIGQTFLTIDEIADFFTEEVDHSFKSQTRRLYDVANVLASLGVVRKVRAHQDRKKGFEWIGAQGFSIEDPPITLEDEESAQPESTESHEQ